MIVEVNGAEIEFPDSMTDQEIEAILRREFGGQQESSWRDPVRQVLKGATFGFADELGSALAAIPAGIATGTNPLDAYREMQQAVSGEQKAYEQANPGTALGLEMLGGLSTGIASGVKALPSLASALPRLPAWATTAMLGGAQGAVYGAGTGDPGNRLENAAEQGLLGAAIAPVAGKVGEVIGDAIGGTASWAGRKLSESPQGTAERVIRRVVDAEGLSADDVINRMGRLGAPAVLADTGENLRGLLRAATDSIGPVKRGARELLEPRQMSSGDRLAEAAQSAFGAQADDFTSMIAKLKQARSATADPLYTQARAEGDDALRSIRDAYNAANPDAKQWDWLSSKLGDRPSLVSGIRNGIIEAKDSNQNPGDNLLSILHAGKEGIDSKIEKAAKAGLRRKVRSLTILKNDLLNFLDGVSPAYKSARDAFAGDSSLLNAANRGKEFFQLDFDEMRDITRSLSQSERQLFRAGAVKAIVDKLDDTELTRDKARQIIGKKSLMKKLSLIVDSPDEAERLVQQAIAEREFARTRLVATGGSQTSGNMKAGEDIQNLAQVGDVLTSVLQGNPLAGLLAAGRAVVNPKELTPEVLAELGGVLLRQGIPESEVRRILTASPLARYSGQFGQVFPNAVRGAVVPGLLAPMSTQ